MQVGQMLQDRRQNMGLSLSALQREMGGSPAPSFLSKTENGHADISASVAVKLADALRLPRDTVLNATGYATTDQQEAAMQQMADLVGTPAPVMVSLEVVNPERPDESEGRIMRARLMRRKEDAFLIDLRGPKNEPYIGEVMATRERKPKEGQAVVAVVDGVAGAWLWHTSRPTGDYLERPDGSDRVASGFRCLGVILRVTSTVELDDE